MKAYVSVAQSGIPHVFESDWNTGYCEGSNKVIQQGLGLERSQVQDQGTLGRSGRGRDGFMPRRALEWNLE